MASRDKSNERKLELLSQLTAQRENISQKKEILFEKVAESKQHLKEQINIPKRISTKVKSSFSDNKTKWFIGSTIGGLIISKFIFGSSSSKSKIKQSASQPGSRGALYTIAGMAARPLIKSLVISKAKDIVLQKYFDQQQISQQEYTSEADYYNGS